MKDPFNLIDPSQVDVRQISQVVSSAELVPSNRTEVKKRKEYVTLTKNCTGP
jgi:hypothetical protein